MEFYMRRGGKEMSESRKVSENLMSGWSNGIS
jgi:hypothetical protein